MRINLFSGPGAGKSVTAAKIFIELKTDRYNVELVHEYIKSWAYENKIPKSFDQYYIFGKQLHSEDVPLSNGVDHIVTDSPLAMQLCYMKKFGSNYFNLLGVIADFEFKFPSINIFLDREELDYQSIGRYQNLEEAKEMDEIILGFMHEFVPNFVQIPTLNFDKIMEVIKQNLNN